jgi:hypothetical protein
VCREHVYTEVEHFTTLFHALAEDSNLDAVITYNTPAKQLSSGPIELSIPRTSLNKLTLQSVKTANRLFIVSQP